MATDTRERIISASAELFSRQGYAGTGVKQIVAAAAAPFGSIYHHFPGGKEQIGAETIRTSGALYGSLIEAIIDPAPDLPSGVGAFFAGAAERLGRATTPTRARSPRLRSRSPAPASRCAKPRTRSSRAGWRRCTSASARRGSATAPPAASPCRSSGCSRAHSSSPGQAAPLEALDAAGRGRRGACRRSDRCCRRPAAGGLAGDPGWDARARRCAARTQRGPATPDGVGGRAAVPTKKPIGPVGLVGDGDRDPDRDQRDHHGQGRWRRRAGR